MTSEVDEELSFHLAMRQRDLEAAGAGPEEAQREARRRFGDVGAVADECRRLAGQRERKVRRLQLLAEVTQDGRHALRQLRRSRGFAATAILTLALGIAATTTIFSVVDGVVLRPLPFPGGDRLVVPAALDLKSGGQFDVTYMDYQQWRREGVFSRLALYTPRVLNAVDAGGPERLRGASTTEDFFPALETAPVLGRLPGPDLYRPGSEATVALSYGLWQSRFGGDRDIVGTTIRLGGTPARIIAVMPRGFDYPDQAQIWLPFRNTPADEPDLQEWDNFRFGAIARLAPGRTLRETKAQLATLAARVARDDPRERQGIGATAEPLSSQLVGQQLTRMLWILLGAVGFVLLIGCVNIANLLLGRSAARARELAVRSALGAGRWRLVRQLLTESALLALIGGVLGALLAWAGVHFLVSHAPPDLPRLEEVRLSGKVLGFAAGVSLLSALVFGLAPALRLSRGARDSGVLTGEELRTTTGVAGRRSRQLLVAGELALSLVLLVGAGLLVRSMIRLDDTDPGFRPDGVVTMELALQGERYEQPQAREAFFRDLLRGLRAVPGVQSASAVSSLPLSGGGSYLGRAFLPEGRPEPPEGHEVFGFWVTAEPGSFETLGIPLLEGRHFTASDDSASVPVMIVNRAFERSMFGKESALGKRVRSWRDENIYRTVVGVVGNVRFFSTDSMRPLVYVPYEQKNAWSGMEAVVRTGGSPAAVAGGLRRAVHAIDPELPVANLRTLRGAFRESVATRRFGTTLLELFAFLALLLASIGIYGVLAYLVTRRRREIGVRMALGASRRDIRVLVLREALVVVGFGLVAGLAGALALSRLMRTLLYEVSGIDAVVFLAVPLILAAVALAASWLPARRAASVDPVVTLRAEG